MAENQDLLVSIASFFAISFTFVMNKLKSSAIQTVPAMSEAVCRRTKTTLDLINPGGDLEAKEVRCWVGSR